MAFHPSAQSSCAGDPGLRAKIGPDEAEPEGCGGSTVEGENEVWPDFHPNDKGPSLGTPDLRRNPSGRGQFSSSLRRSSLADTRYLPRGRRPVRGGPLYASLLTPRPKKNWLPSPPPQ